MVNQFFVIFSNLIYLGKIASLVKKTAFQARLENSLWISRADQVLRKKHSPEIGVCSTVCFSELGMAALI